MAIHPTTASMLKESMREMLSAAEYCISYRKNMQWGNDQVGGCLGYPAAIMLFSIVDTIGAFHRGDENLKIPIDRVERKIRKEGDQHFYVLNSPYYAQHLEGTTIKKVYDNFRSLLVHNLSLPPEHFLQIGAPSDQPFDILTASNGKRIPVVRLVPFLEVSKKAVEKFLKNVDAIVAASEQAKIIRSKTF